MLPWVGCALESVLGFSFFLSDFSNAVARSKMCRPYEYLPAPAPPPTAVPGLEPVPGSSTEVDDDNGDEAGDVEGESLVVVAMVPLLPLPLPLPLPLVTTVRAVVGRLVPLARDLVA